MKKTEHAAVWMTLLNYCVSRKMRGYFSVNQKQGT